MKRFAPIVYLSLALSCLNAHAHWEGNALIGVSAGYAQRPANLKLLILQPAPGFQVTTIIQDLNNNGFMAAILAGYQAKCRRWLLGGEVSADWEGRKEEHLNFAFVDTLLQGWAASGQFKRENILGLTARLGYEVSPDFMPYLRLGLETSRDKLNVLGANAAGTSSFVVDGRRLVTRFLGGLGVEMPLPVVTGLSFRMEYNYLARGKAVEAANLASDNVSIVIVRSKSRINSGKASLIWNFL